jgi:hypothetical protein
LPSRYRVIFVMSVSDRPNATLEGRVSTEDL